MKGNRKGFPLGQNGILPRGGPFSYKTMLRTHSKYYFSEPIRRYDLVGASSGPVKLVNTGEKKSYYGDRR